MHTVLSMSIGEPLAKMPRLDAPPFLEGVVTSVAAGGVGVLPYVRKSAKKGTEPKPKKKNKKKGKAGKGKPAKVEPAAGR